MLVSIYIPTKNRPELLRRAIKSCLDQTYKNIEVVVCSDGDCIMSSRVVDSFNSERIKFIPNLNGGGACKTRNLAILNSRGDYITGLDDDDYFESNRISDFVRIARIRSEKIFFSNYKFISAGGDLKITKKRERINFEHIKNKNYIGNQVFIKREILLEIGLFDEKIPAWQDFDLWFRLLSIHDSAYCINNSSYCVDLSHGHEQITKDPTKIIHAFDYFIYKHRQHLTRDNINKLLVSKYLNKSVALNFTDFNRLLMSGCFIDSLKLLYARLS
ncbi:hypothetical protein DA120_00690 [Aeromonas sp. w55]